MCKTRRHHRRHHHPHGPRPSPTRTQQQGAWLRAGSGTETGRRGMVLTGLSARLPPTPRELRSDQRRWSLGPARRTGQHRNLEPEAGGDTRVMGGSHSCLSKKRSIRPAFCGAACPNMGQAFWVISSVCDNESRLCFCGPRKTFHPGREREDRWQAVRRARGSPRSERMQRVCAEGKPRGRGEQTGADPGAKVSEGRTESRGRRARAPRTRPRAHCPGQTRGSRTTIGPAPLHPDLGAPGLLGLFAY